MLRSQIASALVVAATAGLAGAATVNIPVPNGSFEASQITTEWLTYDAWSNHDGVNYGPDAGLINPAVFNATRGAGSTPDAADGTQYAYLGNGTNTSNAWIDIPAATYYQADATSYTFTARLALRSIWGGGVATGDDAHYINVGIDALNGTGSNVFTQVARGSLNTTTFTDFSVTIDASLVSSTGTMRLYMDKLSGSGLVLTDNWTLAATTVPEPASIALIGLAAAGLMARRRKLA